MNKKTMWAVVAAVIVIGIIWVISDSNKRSSHVSGQSIIIGADLSLSGDAAQDGESIKNGIELAKSNLQKQGVDVRVKYQDDKTDGKSTVSAIQALSAQGVQAIIGPTWSFIADAGVPVADQLHLVAVMPANTSEYVSAKSPYAFFTTIKVHQMVPMLAEWLKSHNIKTIAYFGDEGAWYQTVHGALREAADQAGATIVSDDNLVFGQEASALPTILTKLKGLNADLVFGEIDNDEGISVFLKKVQQLGITGNIMSVTTGIQRVLNSGVDFKGANKFYVLAPKTSAEFESKYEAAYGKKPSAYADTAYDSLMLLVDAMQKRGSTPLADYLKNTTDFKGLTHEYKFDANGDIVGGEWVVNALK